MTKKEVKQAIKKGTMLYYVIVLTHSDRNISRAYLHEIYEMEFVEPGSDYNEWVSGTVGKIIFEYHIVGTKLRRSEEVNTVPNNLYINLEEARRGLVESDFKS